MGNRLSYIFKDGGEKDIKSRCRSIDRITSTYVLMRGWGSNHHVAIDNLLTTLKFASELEMIRPFRSKYLISSKDMMIETSKGKFYSQSYCTNYYHLVQIKIDI